MGRQAIMFDGLFFAAFLVFLAIVEALGARLRGRRVPAQTSGLTVVLCDHDGDGGGCGGD